MIAFYVFMLICTLLVPFVLLYFGHRWKTNPPQKINSIYGYRTSRSMAGEKTWYFAHAYIGEIWVKLGWFTLIVTLVLMLILAMISLEILVVSIAGCLIVFAQAIPVGISLILTERALKREFGD